MAARNASTTITNPTTSSAQPRGSTWPLASPNRRQSARQAISRLATTRIAASASAARCSALPWPYAWPGSAGRSATPSATNVRIAAIRSVPECAASESRPRLLVAIPARSLTAIRTQAATIETSAVRRWGLTTRKDHTTRRARFRGPSGALPKAVRYALAMSPRNRSFRHVPAPLPLSYQWRNLSDWCLRALYSKSNLQDFELSKHENVALGPKNVAIQTSVKPQSAGQVAFGLNVPPVTLPRR